jgi:hypothetical protein
MSHLKALARKAPPAGALKLIVEAMARGETQPLMSSFGHQTACELLGLTGDRAAASHRTCCSPSLPAHRRSGPR